MDFITMEDFKNAGVGSVYMAACPECEKISEALIFKNKGTVKENNNYGSYFPQVCEFCYMLKGAREEDDSIIGMAKCINKDNGDTIAFLGIAKGHETLKFKDMDNIPLEHGMTLEAEVDDDKFTIIGVKDED